MSQIFKEDGTVVPVTLLSLINEIDIDNIKEGSLVKISGLSKGKGFQGVVKRWGFKGSSSTHGTKHTKRAPGSIGSSFPEKVFKGRKMAGRMGNRRVTIGKIEIVSVDPKKKLVALKGAVPGPSGRRLEIYES